MYYGRQAVVDKENISHKFVDHSLKAKRLALASSLEMHANKICSIWQIGLYLKWL